MSRRNSALVLVVVGFVLAGAWQGNRLVNRHTVAGWYIPTSPSQSAWPAVMVERVAAAEAQARSWFRSSQGLAELSRLYHANGLYPEATTCYEGLQQIEPTNARWPHLHASIMTNFGRMDDALPLSRKAVDLAPDYIPARLRLGDLLLKSNRFDEAATVYVEVLRRDSANAYALLGLARCDLAAGNWTKARERLREDVAKNPEFVGALSLLVTVSEHFEEWSAAETLRTSIGRREFSDLPDPWLDDLSDVCFNAYRLSVAAAIANAAGNRTTALALLDRAIELAPEASSYRRQAGRLLMDAGDFSGAKKMLEKAVEANPTDSDAWLRLIEALRGLGQDQAALNIILTGLGHCPQSPSLHLEYARALRSTNRLEEALAQFRYGFELRSSEASPLIEIAAILLQMGRSEEALVALQQALVLQPDHPMALASLMFYAMSQSDEAGALARWKQIQRQPRTPPAVIDSLQQYYQQQFGRRLP